jgi:hypothetical protein
MPLSTWGQLVDDAEKSGNTGGFKPLDPGEYDFRITASELKKSQSGKTGFNISAEVEGGPYANKKLFNTFWVSPDSPTAMGIFFRQFAALGLDGEYFRKEPTDEQIVADLVGRRFHGVVKHRDYNGQPQADLANVTPARGPAPVNVAKPAVEGVPANVPTPDVPASNVSDGWGTATPAAPTAPATPTAPPLPPLGVGGSPF